MNPIIIEHNCGARPMLDGRYIDITGKPYDPAVPFSFVVIDEPVTDLALVAERARTLEFAPVRCPDPRPCPWLAKFLAERVKG